MLWMLLTWQAYAAECPGLNGKYMCGKRFEAEIVQTGPAEYRLKGPFDLPEAVVADGLQHFDPESQVEFYQAACKDGKLIVTLLTLRENQTKVKDVHLVAHDVYSVQSDGTVLRERSSDRISEMPARSKMYCIPQP